MSRAIDGAVLTEWISGECKSPSCPKNESAFGMRIMKHIDRMPTIEPERKTGIWKNRSLNILYPEWERYECSVCGGYSYIHKYCPNCGAKMEGGD